MPRDTTGHFYFSWYPTIFRADTRHLTFAERGAYRDLLDEYMTTRTPLRNDDRGLASIIGCDINIWITELKTQLVPFFVTDGVFLRHKFCDELLVKDNSRIVKSKTNGAKGGRPTTKSKIKEITQPVKEVKPLTEQNNTKQNSLFSENEEGSFSPAATQKKKITFSFDSGKFENITDQQIAVWKEAYPAVSVEAEINKMQAWQMSNPKLKKSNYLRFMNSWLSGTQDRAGGARGKSNFVSFDEQNKINNNKAREEALKKYVT